eukprot:2312043-Pyramimonas_sp.AAC.1
MGSLDYMRLSAVSHKRAHILTPDHGMLHNAMKVVVWQEYKIAGHYQHMVSDRKVLDCQL